jgi:RHS repeat-associated protein
MVQDASGRLIQISSPGVQDLTVAWNTNDTVASLTNNSTPSQSATVGYDSALRVSNYGGNGTAANPSLAYGYDAVGNRTSGTENGATVTPTVSPTSNRITALSGPQWRNLNYNALGHLASETRWDGSRSYGYDAFERLNSLSINGSTVGQYWSNALNQRAMKRTSAGDTRYVYGQGGELLSESGAGGTVNHIWLFGQPLAVVKNGSLFYVHGDQLGRPEVLSTPAGAVAWRANLSGWNRTVAVDAVGGYHVGYPGQYFDAESGLWYNWNRYYDGQLGRYIQSDPIGLRGGINTYTYVKGKPLTMVDPDGRLAFVLIPAIPTVVKGVAFVGSAVLAAYALHKATPNVMQSSAYPPGFWPGDAGADEWGRRNDVGAKEGRRRFHDIKKGQRGKPGSRASDSCCVNPDTGEVVDGLGEDIGNLGD